MMTGVEEFLCERALNHQGRYSDPLKLHTVFLAGANRDWVEYIGSIKLSMKSLVLRLFGVSGSLLLIHTEREGLFCLRGLDRLGLPS